MRAFLAGLVAFGLFVVPAAAQACAGNRRDGGATGEMTSASLNTEQLRSSRVGAPDLARQVSELRAEVATQQEQIKQLQKTMQANDQALLNALREIQQLKNGPSVATEAHPTAAPREIDGNDQQGLAFKDTVNGPTTDPLRPAVTVGAQPFARNDKEFPASNTVPDKLTIGGLFFGDYSYYYKTGFGPQFLTQINPPGPGNNGYNAFEVSRAYLDLSYSPSSAITLRLTPNIYRQIGAAPGFKYGAVSGIGANTNTELTYRLKYAYGDFNTLFAGIAPLKGDKLTAGQQPNVLVDWEENLYGFRWVNLTPWNYLSLASAQTGVAMHGPVKFDGKQYFDYGVAVYGNSTFHTLEESETKQTMERVSFYPFGTNPASSSASYAFQGLGLTEFFDYGYTNVTPDTPANRPVSRLAVLAHFTSKANRLSVAGEYDRGRNAFTSGNLFSGSGPADEFGLGPTPYANFDGLAQALLNYNGTEQQGFAFFGHINIPRSKFTPFGMYEYFQPNIRVFRNPFDFERFIVGISYQYNDYVRLGLDAQNLLYTRNQFTFPAGELARFNPVLAAENPGGIPNSVPSNMQAIFFNMEFKFNRDVLH
jgi:hypothetical protein